MEFVCVWAATPSDLYSNNGSFLTNYLFSLALQWFNILEAITSCQVSLNELMLQNVLVGTQTERETFH